MSVLTRALVLCSVFAVARLSSPTTAFSQQENFFYDSVQTPNSVFVFDNFVGSYTDVQSPSSSSGTGNAELSIGGTPPNPFIGGFIDEGDLVYTHDAVNPAFDIALAGLENARASSSLVVQFATTETPSTMTGNEFSIPGLGNSDEFFFLGTNGTVDFAGTNFDINYYWAEWNGLVNSTTIETSVLIDDFRVVGGAKVMHFNSDTVLNISEIAAIPEPGLGLLPLFIGLISVQRRRRG